MVMAGKESELESGCFLMFIVYPSPADGLSELPAGVGQVVYQTLKSDISAASSVKSCYPKRTSLTFGLEQCRAMFKSS